MEDDRKSTITSKEAIVFNAFLFCFLICTSFFAYGRTTPCPGECGISAEWLVVLPAIEDPEFAVLHGANDTIIPNDQSWHSGYRIDLIYNFCRYPIDFLFRWTHFPSFSDSKKVSGNVTNLIIQNEGFNTGVEETFHVHYLDFLLGWRAVDCSCFLIAFQGGIQYARIRFLETSTLISEGLGNTLFKNRSRLLWGAGPEIGADFNFNFWKCFELTARGYGVLLVNKRIARLEVENPGGAIAQTTSNKNYVGVVPFINTRAGISYSRLINLCDYLTCLRPFNLDVEAGYEASWFFNSVARIQVNANTASEMVKWMSFALHGPYLHVGIAF
ncbi:MAG: Lpg1974 family pore-forming outer membrane protein [Chlamydiales bacterium]